MFIVGWAVPTETSEYHLLMVGRVLSAGFRIQDCFLLTPET
ncbi:hypothetical protein D1AOALGA4SA_5464 [Olavius algarvensis Delta 1 endosymbiont]|nr:hypothetical protein D1AOALGA4SA_5464 [Olavius algarvensis Delta 1 endosymbiont]